MLIVVTIISILSLIVIPRVKGAVRQSKEAALMANLREMRMAIMHFQSDTGVFPLSLTDLIRLKNDPPIVGLSPMDGEEEIIPDPRSYNGPYLLPYSGIGNTGLPFNTAIPDYATAPLEEQWHYRFERGEGMITCPASIGATLGGRIPYHEL
jgi:type II secretory pathway pseudopilin PulG